MGLDWLLFFSKEPEPHNPVGGLGKSKKLLLYIEIPLIGRRRNLYHTNEHFQMYV
jgi:hypothetical protein